jgi:hypothetical protein
MAATEQPAAAAALPPEESDASIWKWMGADTHPQAIDMVVRQQAKLLGDHSAALESGMTGLARITRRLDHQVMAIAYKVAEHEGTAEAMTHPDDWLTSPASSRATTPAAGMARAQSPLATTRAPSPLLAVEEPAAAAAALEAEIAAQEKKEAEQQAAAAKAAEEAAKAAEEAAKAAEEAAKAAEEAAAAEAEQKRIEHDAAIEAADEAERARLNELEEARLDAAEKERARLEEETRKAAEAAAVAKAAEEKAAAANTAKEAAAAEAAEAAAAAAAAATAAAAAAPAPAPAPGRPPAAAQTGDGAPAVRSIAGNSEAIAKLKSTVNAEAKGRLELYNSFTTHVKSMEEFQQEVRDALSKLRWQGDENDKRLRGLDLRVSKVERPSNAASVTMGLPEALPDALEFVETQIRQLELKLKNIESGMNSESPIAGELDRLLNRVRGVETHSQRQSQLLDHVVHQLEADAAAEAVFSTIDHTELTQKLDAEAEAKVAEGEDPPQHYSESSLYQSVQKQALSIGGHMVTKHLTAHHLPGHHGRGIGILTCFHHWVKACDATRSGSSAATAAVAPDASATDAVDEEGSAAADTESTVPNIDGTQVGESSDGAGSQDQMHSSRRLRPSGSFNAVLEEKVNLKMERHLALAKLGEQIQACQEEEEILGGMRETKADKGDLQKLMDEAAEMQAMLDRMEQEVQAARAQAEAAAAAAALAAGKGSDGPSPAELAALAQPTIVDSSEQDAMLEKLRAQLDGLETTVDDQNKDAQTRLAGLQKKIDPLTGLPYDLDKLRLEELPDKASQLELDKLRLAQEQALKDMEALANSQMTPEMEAALAELMSMRDMKKLVGEQGRQLADLFTTKVGGDDLKKITDDLAASDQQLQERLDAHVLELVTQFQETKEAQAAQMGELDATVSAKADKEWMDSLEKEIIAEVERLRAAGKAVITKPELDRRLAELRKKIGKGGGTEVGSAAFRCIACNRPLPDMSQWHIDLAGSTHETKRPTKPKFGTKELAGLPQHEIVLRGGFPMVNPKVKSRDRRVAGDLRLFGRNMVDISDDGEIDLGGGGGGGGPNSSSSAGGSSSRRVSSRRSNPVSSLSSPQSLAPLDEKGSGNRRRGSPVPPMHLNMRPQTSGHDGAFLLLISLPPPPPRAPGSRLALRPRLCGTVLALLIVPCLAVCVGGMHASPWPSAGTPNSFGSVSPDTMAMHRHQKAHRPQTSPSDTGGGGPLSPNNAAAAARLQAQRAI